MKFVLSERERKKKVKGIVKGIEEKTRKKKGHTHTRCTHLILYTLFIADRPCVVVCIESEMRTREVDGHEQGEIGFSIG